MLFPGSTENYKSTEKKLKLNTDQRSKEKERYQPDLFSPASASSGACAEALFAYKKGELDHKHQPTIYKDKQKSDSASSRNSSVDKESESEDKSQENSSNSSKSDSENSKSKKSK